MKINPSSLPKLGSVTRHWVKRIPGDSLGKRKVYNPRLWLFGQSWNKLNAVFKAAASKLSDCLIIEIAVRKAGLSIFIGNACKCI